MTYIKKTFFEQSLSFKTILTLTLNVQKLGSILQLSILLLIDSYMISSSIPDVCLTLLLYFTILVTVVSMIRSFSKSFLIKDYVQI